MTFFPYKNVRPVQKEFIALLQKAFAHRRNVVVHAPTGLGKTAGSLAPALLHAVRHGCKVLFLTSRHTQHRLAVQTARDIVSAHGPVIRATDIIGKKWLCLDSAAAGLLSGEFMHYCRQQKEEGLCEYYMRTIQKTRLTAEAMVAVRKLSLGIWHSEEIVRQCREKQLCPYEISLALARESTLVIADYFHIFNQGIAEQFFLRTDTRPQDCILIVDEAHNLPDRIRDLASARLSSAVLVRAKKEAERFGLSSIRHVNTLRQAVTKMMQPQERTVEKNELLDLLGDVSEMLSDLELEGEEVRRQSRQSYIGSLHAFLRLWAGPSEGYVKILKEQGQLGFLLENLCLDPSVVSQPVFSECHSAVLMSGTLLPTRMYCDILGISAEEAAFKSPFPKSNRRNLVVPVTSTKFSARNSSQYKRIASICAHSAACVRGNTLMFFPSYFFRDMVYQYFGEEYSGMCFLEKSNMPKEERDRLVDRFRAQKEKGAVLMAVASGSFSEGIDLPGNSLSCVVVVGLPFTAPDLYSKSLIEYYERRFGTGWDYGYVFGAWNRVLQAAGRCIRSETDRGAVVFLDERYIWPRYRKLFPPDWDMLITKNPAAELRKFFDL